ncbi:DUF2807 domain-containing protein [Winogradskyella sp. SYSU M77433]|uniref:GIN domain-containing protein n=1 Tax=Winogradskyella sp. SYSU M77433 TaxID=3042722 RepID=UPI00248110B1|nr:DUF2807 domain-containing protein [Winogradskyella sp. SYSU M77433]MDH7912882.1 DUF2807 domain-containing protein [Winogradskyella sp. SYSU M77433]
MKKILLILAFIGVGMPLIQAQTDDKIKGDRNVTIKQTYIDDFHTIVVDGDFSLEVVYNSKPSVEVEADDNLHEVIQFDVNDGVLKFTESVRITSKKRLNIKVNYGDALKNIEVKGDGEIRSLTSMELTDVSLITADNSRAYLNIRAKTFDYKSLGKSKTRLNLTADSTKMELSDNSKLDALVNTKTSNFDLYQRADISIEGSANSTVIRLINSSNFNGSNYEVNNVDASLEDNSDLTIAANKTITLTSSGDSETYLYGNSVITIKQFEGTSKLQKKEK